MFAKQLTHKSTGVLFSVNEICRITVRSLLVNYAQIKSFPLYFLFPVLSHYFHKEIVFKTLLFQILQ